MTSTPVTREERAAEVERLDGRGVVADDVVLGGHGEVDARGDEREHAVLGGDGRVEARARVDVEIAAEDTGRGDDVARRELDLGHAPGRDVDVFASMLHSMPLVAATR